MVGLVKVPDGVSRRFLTLPAEDRYDFAALYQVYLLDSYHRLNLVPGDRVLDAGAHVGVFTAMASRRVGPSGRLIAIEADPKNYAKLLSTIHRNQLENVVAVNAALWGSSGESLGLAGEGTMTSVTAAKTLKRGTVRSVTLDVVLSENGFSGLDKAKVDIEGAEAEVFGARGNEAIEGVHRLAVEMHGDKIKRQIESYLAMRGFHQVCTDERNERGLSLVRNALLNPLWTSKLELMNRFRTIQRVLGDFARSVPLGGRAVVETFERNRNYASRDVGK
jgi:FkbM family methyltransferase